MAVSSFDFSLHVLSKCNTFFLHNISVSLIVFLFLFIEAANNTASYNIALPDLCGILSSLTKPYRAFKTGATIGTQEDETSCEMIQLLGLDNGQMTLLALVKCK